MSAALKTVDFKARYVAYNYQATAPVKNISAHKTKKSESAVRRAGSPYIKYGIGIFVYALLLAGLSLYNHVLDYSITALQSDIDRLYTDNQRLEYRIEQLSSLERVEQVAVSELGMLRPELQNIYILNTVPQGHGNAVFSSLSEPVWEQQFSTAASLRENLFTMASAH